MNNVKIGIPEDPFLPSGTIINMASENIDDQQARETEEKPERRLFQLVSTNTGQ
jgi:hypothetical protein